MNTEFKTVEEYIASFPIETQKILTKIRSVIKKMQSPPWRN